MNFSVTVKNELLTPFSSDCCKVACLSAFLRTSGSFESVSGKIGVSTSSEHHINEYFSKIIEKIYGVIPTVKQDRTRSHTKMTVIGNSGVQILIDSGIIFLTDNGVELNLNIDEGIIANDCCKKAFVIGAFLGSGTVTIPNLKESNGTGYHLEFVFSKYVTALDFTHILAEIGFMAKLIERKNNFVVYFKTSEEICDLLAFMGAKKSVLEVNDLIVSKDVKNRTNRQRNCDVSNINKQVDASIKMREDIDTVIKCLGLERLPKQLSIVAVARKENPDLTLKELADKLGITKSCLCHRLRKISKIAESI